MPEGQGSGPSNAGRGPNNGGRGAPGGRGGGGQRSPGGRQVYSDPIGPMSGTGDPMGSAGQHYNEKGTGLLGALDRFFGYDNVGQRDAAFNNNPSRRGSSFNPFVATVPSYPFATPGYVLGSVLSAPMSPMGAVPAALGIARAIATNSPYEGMAQKIATEMGASRGPRGADVGVGTDRGGRGGALGLLDARASGNGLISTAHPMAQAQPAQQQADMYQRRNYALGLNGVPGPSPYSYQTARWL